MADDEGNGGCLVLVLVLAMLGGVGAAFYVNFKSETLVALVVGEHPSTGTFNLEASSDVEVWAEVDVTHRGISAKSSNDTLPHVIDYAITLTRDDEVILEQRCNPFDSNFMRWSGSGNGGRRYDGLLRGCGMRGLEPGQYAVSVKSVRVKDDARIRLKKTVLFLRTP